MDSKTTVGPLVRDSQRQALAKQVDDAKLRWQDTNWWKSINRDGYFYEPTIVSNVNHDMKIVREEVFGPASSYYSREQRRRSNKGSKQFRIWIRSKHMDKQYRKRYKSGKTS